MRKETIILEVLSIAPFVVLFFGAKNNVVFCSVVFSEDLGVLEPYNNIFIVGDNILRCSFVNSCVYATYGESRSLGS